MVTPSPLQRKFSTRSEVDILSHKLLKLETELNSNIPSTLWISDIHGEGDRFKSILRGKFGMLYQTCVEALPKTFSTEKIQYLVRIIRKQNYVFNEEIKLDHQDVIMSLIQILRYKLSNIEYDIRELVLPEFRDTIQRLISELPVPDPVFEEEIIANRLISHLSQAIKRVLLDRIMVLGDIFDRGPQPDKIIRFLTSKAYKNAVHYVFGNHDILWMGAAAGCRSLIAEAIRISSRYDHFELMRRLGFDISKLETFARETYPVEQATGRFKAKTDSGIAMEKALTVIQFKLEEKTITEHPEYDMNSRMWLDRLAMMLKTGDTDGLNDSHFPTIDFDNPSQLSEMESTIIDDLEKQFVNNPKLKRLLRFFFEDGHAYKIYNDTLNIHALIPSTEDGEFEEFLDKKGKDLLDYVQTVISRVGKSYVAGTPQKEKDLAFMFYLWCGPKSPFFGKSAMKTFERYFLLDKASHEEKSLYWKTNLLTKEFKDKIMHEFGARKVIFGHTPVDVTKGKNMASDDGVAINIDGGFAAAYYNRGHALVQTPTQMYGIILPTPQEIEEARLSAETVPLSVEIIDKFDSPVKVKNTSRGTKIGIEKAKLKLKLRQIHANDQLEYQ